MCPVADVPLVDHALGRLGSVTTAVAVNAHVTQPSLATHVAERAHVSVEEGAALGTAGALGALRAWIDGRGVVVVNADTWCPGGLEYLVAGWDGEAVRVLVAGNEPFGPTAPVAGTLLPWSIVRDLTPTPTGLWEVVWRDALAAGLVETVAHHGPLVDCADAADYLAANLLAAGGSVIGHGADVAGEVVESVVWDGAEVPAGERLVRAIRTDARTTVLVRRPRRERVAPGAG